MGSVTLQFFSYLQEPAFKIHYSNLHSVFPLVHAFLYAHTPPPLSLPPFVISVRRQALIVPDPQLQLEQLHPAPFTGLINSQAVGIPRASQGRTCLLPKQAGLSGPLWG